MSINSLDLIIGRKDSSEYLNATIDELMIFNRSLTEQQVQDIYNNQSQRFKSEGTQTFRHVNIIEGKDTVNVSVVGLETNFGTNISARIGYWYVADGYNESDNGLVGYWHFDESSWSQPGDVKDALGKYNGTAGGDASITTFYQVFEKAGDFDGNGDYVNISGIASIDSLTISAWFKLKNHTNNDKESIANAGDASVSSAPSFKLQWQGDVDDKLRWVVNDGASTLTVYTSVVNDEDWHHVAATADEGSDEIKIYLDGSLSDSDSGSTIGIGVDPLAIGSDLGLSNSLNGTIDEVMIFNRTLSEDEVKELYVLGRVKWLYTDYEGLDKEFEISRNSTNILPDFKFYSNNYDFYTHILRDTIELNVWGSCECPDGQNWNWNFAKNCTLLNGACNVKNITAYGSGTWTLKNYTINCTDFDINSSGEWYVMGLQDVNIIGS